MELKDYLEQIKELVKNPTTDELKKVLYEINFELDEVEPNASYFKTYFENGFSAYDALKRIKKEQQMLYRLPEKFSDYIIENEYNNRDLIDLSNVDTWDLEDELNGRIDSNLKEIEEYNDYDLLSELERRGNSKCIILDDYNGDNFYENLAKILKLSNCFSYSKTELLDIITEKLCK